MLASRTAGLSTALLASFCLCEGAARAQQEGAAAAEVAAQIQELYILAGSSEEQGEIDSAEMALRDAMDLNPESATTHRRLGALLYWNGAPSEGMSLLYRASALAPADLTCGKALIDALLDERDYYFNNGDASSADAALERADQTLKPLLATNTDDRTLMRRKAQILWRRPEDPEESLGVLEGLLQESPNDAELHHDYIQAVGHSAAFEQALRFYEELPTEYWLSCWFTGQVHVHRAHYHYNRYLDSNQAVSDYRRAGELVLESARLNDEYFSAATENYSFYRAWTGWTLLRANELEAAEREFFEALGRDPNNASAQEGLSHLGLKLNEVQGMEVARDFYRRACLWVPHRSDFWNNYGLFCRDTGKYEESYAAYRRALAAEPADPRILNDCALILQYHLGRDLDLAEAWLLEARTLGEQKWINALDEVTRQDALVTYGDALVNLARLYDGQGRMLEASECWNELRNTDPSRPELP